MENTLKYDTRPEWLRALTQHYPQAEIKRQWPCEMVYNSAGNAIAGWHPDLKGYIQLAKC